MDNSIESAEQLKVNKKFLAENFESPHFMAENGVAEAPAVAPKLVNKRQMQLTELETVEALSAVLTHRQQDSPKGFISRLPKFQRTYKVFRDIPSDPPVIAEIKGNIAVPVDSCVVKTELRKYCSALTKKQRLGSLRLSCISAAVTDWSNDLDISEPMPMHWAWRAEPGLAFNRLEYEPQSCSWAELGAAAPVFTSIIGRVSEGDLLCQWIGSLFVKGSDRRQVVWLEGPAQSSKSLLAELVASLFGDELSFMGTNQSVKSPYLISDIEHKRLVVIDEAELAFLRTPLFKALTGSSRHSADKKFVAARQTAIDCKFLFTSNIPLEIKRDDAVMSRILRFKMLGKFKGEWKSFETLKSEMTSVRRFIAGYCVDRYMAESSNKGSVKATAAALEEACAVSEEGMKEILEDNFVVGSPHRMSAKQFSSIMDTIFLSVPFEKKREFKQEFINYVRSKYPFVEVNKSIYCSQKKISIRSFLGIKPIN